MRFLLLSLAVCLVPALSREARADDARAIVERAVRAHGGEARIDKFTASQTQTRGTITEHDKSMPFTQEISFQLPDRVKEVIEMDVNGARAAITTVFDGARGWMKYGDDTREFNERYLTEMKEASHLARVARLTPLLRDSRYQLSSLGEVQVSGRPAQGVRVVYPGFRDVNIYLDKATGLLIQTQRQAVDPKNGLEFTEDRVISAYQVVQGIQSPRKIVVFRNDRRFMEVEVAEVKFLDRLDDNLFVKP